MILQCLHALRGERKTFSTVALMSRREIVVVLSIDYRQKEADSQSSRAQVTTWPVPEQMEREFQPVQTRVAGTAGIITDTGWSSLHLVLFTEMGFGTDCGWYLNGIGNCGPLFPFRDVELR